MEQRSSNYQAIYLLFCTLPKKVEKQKKLILEFDFFIFFKKFTGLAMAHHGGPLMTNKAAALAKFLENVTNFHTWEDNCD